MEYKFCLFIAHVDVELDREPILGEVVRFRENDLVVLLMTLRNLIDEKDYRRFMEYMHRRDGDWHDWMVNDIEETDSGSIYHIVPSNYGHLLGGRDRSEWMVVAEHECVPVRA